MATEMDTSLDFERVLAALPSFSDDELAGIEETVYALRHHRALEAGDIDALCDLGFEEGFKSNGLPADPFVAGGFIICAGGKVNRSTTSHDCGFVSLNDEWVWESEAAVADVVRHPPASKPRMASVTLVVPCEGLELDLVVSKATMNSHKAQSVRSFRYTGGQLEMISSRNRTPKTGHR